MINSNQKLYNVVKLPLTDGLSNHPLPQGAEYIMLYKESIGANVSFKYNETSNDSIDIPVGTKIKTTGAETVFVTADAVAGGILTIIQAVNSDTFELFPPVIVQDIDTINSIGGFDDALLAKLGKIAEPYEDPTLTSYSTTTTGNFTVFSLVLTCDKITVWACEEEGGSSSYLRGHFALDGVMFWSCDNNTLNATPKSDYSRTLYNVKGKTLTFVSLNTLGTGIKTLNIHEFVKKG